MATLTNTQVWTTVHQFTRALRQLHELPLGALVESIDALQISGEVLDGSKIGNTLALAPNAVRESAEVLHDALVVLRPQIAQLLTAARVNPEALVE